MNITTIAIVVRSLIDVAISVHQFWHDKKLAVLFFGFLIADLATLWMAAP